MHSAVLQHIQNLFEGKTLQSPVVIGASWGWKAQTTYGHVSANTFPIRMKPICGRKMVSIIDYIEWLEADIPSPALATTPEQPEKLARGRPTKAIALARQAAAKQKNGGGE